jgi:hypothetical protein
MSIGYIIFIIIHLFVFSFIVEAMRRLAIRNREYPLDETKETLPFGLLKLRHVVIIFLTGYVAWVVFSIWLYDYFIRSL